MSSNIVNLQKSAWRSLQAMRGELIRYHIDEDTSIEIPLAVMTRPTNNRIEAADAVSIESREWHWLVDPEDLVQDGQPLEPKNGHWIIRGSDGAKFRIQPGSTGETVWRWSDPHHTWLRVFCEEA